MTEKQKLLMKRMKALVKADILDDDDGLGICLDLREDEQIDKMLAFLDEHTEIDRDEIVHYAFSLSKT